MSVPKKLLLIKFPASNKVLPPLEYACNYDLQTKFQLTLKDRLKIYEFMNDCERFGFHKPEDWYVDLLENIKNVLPDMAKLIELELKSIASRCSDQELDHREFCVLEEHRNKTSLAMKLFFEGITKDRTGIPGAPEKRVQHDLRKIRKIYFTSHLLLHISNSVYTGPLQKELSDNLYVKHTDINYIYNTLVTLE